MSSYMIVSTGSKDLTKSQINAILIIDNAILLYDNQNTDMKLNA